MMHALQTLLILHALTCVGQRALGSEIIGGTEVKKPLPYMASVQNQRGHACGGFLVSKDFVLTAAHCDDKHPITSVVLGTNNLDNDRMRYRVRRCRPRSYVNAANGSDIMLLKLIKKEPLDKRIRPISLPKSQPKLKAREKCSVAGWGSTRSGATRRLQAADVPIISPNVCSREWMNLPRPVRLPAGVICAGGYGTDKGFCQGDSGGPLVCRGEAVGVVSFNYLRNCDYPNVPNVYTDIHKFLPWIREILRTKNCKA